MSTSRLKEQVMFLMGVKQTSTAQYIAFTIKH